MRIVLLLALLTLPFDAFSQNSRSPAVRVLIGPSIYTSGDYAGQAQIRVALPLWSRLSLQPFIQWREHASTTFHICPIFPPCVDRVTHHDALGAGGAVTVDFLGSGGHHDVKAYLGSYLARQWAVRDGGEADSASGFLVGGAIAVSPGVALGGEVQVGFSRDTSGPVHVTPVLQLVVGR